MAGDTSRDLIDVVKIWQNKEITVIGEPVNTISNNPIQVFFGSLHLYFGLLGLLLTGFDPAGSVVVNIVFGIVSIPFFYVLAKKLLKKQLLSYTATFIYALSPVVVALTRSYWEPNTVIAISVFAWYFFLVKKSKLSFFVAGILSGIIFDIHYMNAIVVVFYIALLLFEKNKKHFMLSVLGFLLAISPLIVFELRNSFFLTKAFIDTFGGFSTFSERTLNPFFSMDVFAYIFGFGYKQYFIPALFEIPFKARMAADTLIGVPFVYFLLRKQKVFNSKVVASILIGLIIGWYFEKWNLLAIRYMLSVYPLFVIAFCLFVTSINKYLVLILFIPGVVLSVKTITHRLDSKDIDDYISLSRVEEIAGEIVKDDPQGRYNVTENILGDARSLAFRFYLLRDAKVKPQGVETYNNLDSLYVITPSLERTYKEERWEFKTAALGSISWGKDFGDLKLFKFVR